MKIASLSTSLAAAVLVLAAGRAPLHAQPATAPIGPQPPTAPRTESTGAQPVGAPAASPGVPQPPSTASGAHVDVSGDDQPWNQGVTLQTREAARALFLEGNRLFNVPLFSRAAEQYAAALAQWKHPAFHYNLALAQLNLGQEVEAHGNLELALRHGEEPLGPEQFAEAKKQLADTEAHLARIQITCPTPGAEVTLDGATLFIGPGSHAGWVTAKPHELTAKKPGYLAQARRLAFAPGQLQTLDLKLVTLSEAADTGRRWAVWKPWAVVAGGAVIGAAAGGLHALSANNFASYDRKFAQQSCAQSGGCKENELPADLKDQLSGAERQQKIAVAGYIAGGSVVAAGVVLLYMNRPRLREQAPASTQLAVLPTISDDTLGVSLLLSH